MQLLSDMTNAQVVEQLRAGDDMTFTRLYEASYRMVYFQAFKILGQADEAELVAQDVFITVFRRIDNLKDPEALRAWIIGVTVRLAMNWRRKLSSSHEFALEEEAVFDLLDSGGAEHSPEDDMDERETGLILGELLDQLPEEQRTAVMLYYYDEYSVKDISAVMGCAEGTVKSRLNYARKALEKLIVQREERDGIRLHSFSPAMIFLAICLQEKNLAVDQGAMERGLAAVKGALGITAAAGGAAASVPVTASATAAVGGAGAAGIAAEAAGAAAGSGGSAVLFGGISVKVAAGVIAGVFAVGGLTAGLVTSSGRSNTAEPTQPAIYAEIPTAAPEEAAAVPTLLPAEESEEPALLDETEPPEEPEIFETSELPAETDQPTETDQPAEPDQSAEAVEAEDTPVESPAIEAPSEGFIIENGVLTGYNGSGGHVVIPDGVTAIGDWVFFGNGSLTSLTIPEGVGAIGVGAFQGCTNLASATFPNTLRSIGTNSFSGTGLTAVVIPDSVASIGDGVFQSCASLTSVSIGGGVTSMGSGIFYRCAGLSSLSLADSMSTLGISTFSGCTGLTTVKIPGGVTKLDYEVFADCTGLTDVVIPGGVTAIGYRAFAGCSKLAGVTIPESVTAVDATAFEDTPWLAARNGE